MILKLKIDDLLCFRKNIDFKVERGNIARWMLGARRHIVRKPSFISSEVYYVGKKNFTDETFWFFLHQCSFLKKKGSRARITHRRF